MALSLQQVARQSQRLIMTPQMQQSIQLLQMNAIELEQLTQTELLENPFLQLEEDRADGSEEFQSNGKAPKESEAPPEPQGDSQVAAGTSDDFLKETGPEASAGEEPPPPSYDDTGSSNPATEISESASDTTATLEEKPELFAEVDVNWEDFYEGAENRTYTREPDEEEHDFSEYTAAKMSLYEQLMWQLRVCALMGKEADIGEYLIGCIDEDGYIDVSCMNEAAEKFEVELPVVERVLSVLQEFEPIGIAARTSAECLLLQLKALGTYTETARVVMENHFEALQRKKFKEIAKEVGASEDEIVDLYHKVGRLEPKPGRSYSKEPIQYITPDVYVKLIDGELTIFLNEGSSGHLSINRLYRRLLRMQEKALTREEKAYAMEKFRGALMLIKNIEKRKSTILRVTEAIMEVQREFLTKGVEVLKPLTLREVADMVGMHESTIARVTSSKYVETPQGLFPLKYFFSSSIESSNAGGAVSSRSIKDKLGALVEGENPKRPLSDQKIVEILNKEGFDIARRTVAKYRDQLKILPAKLRRQA